MRAIACLSIAGLLLAACSAKVKEAPHRNTAEATAATQPDKPPKAPPSPAPAQFPAIDASKARYAVRSDIPTFVLIPIDTVPRIERNTEETGCGDWGMIEPQSVGGKLAQSLGWKVSSEEKLGRLTAVIVQRKYEFWSGAECIGIEAKLLVFEGKDVVAALYRREERGGYPVQWVEGMESGSVRVHAAVPMVPLGDLSFDGTHIRFGPMPAVNLECGGRVKLPNVFKLPIEGARKKLFRFGWKPVKQPREPIDPLYPDTRLRHIPEWEACGGKQWCRFHYASPGGTLTLVTGTADEGSGLEEWVITADAECRVPRR